MRRWADFDRWFSAPLSGYDDLDAYYHYLSSGHFVAGTTAPVLIVNALNDPIVPLACTPVELGRRHPLVTVETPALGGHVGFRARKGATGRRCEPMEGRAERFFRTG